MVGRGRVGVKPQPSPISHIFFILFKVTSSSTVLVLWIGVSSFFFSLYV